MRYTSKLFLSALAFSFLFSSCSSNSDKENIVLNEMIVSLEASNIHLDKSSQTFLSSLDDMLSDPLTNEKAKIWKPKAEEVARLSKELYNYISQIKDELKKASTNKDENWEKSFDKTNKAAVNKILFDNDLGEKLVIRVKDHKKNLLKIDSNIRLEFQNSYFFPVEETADYYFKGTRVLESLAFLTRMQNSIKVNENRIIAFCNYKVPNIICGWGDNYSVIIGQSSNIVKPNDKIVISAGVGSFSRAALAQIFVNNKKVDLNEMAVAHDTLRTSTKSGNYSVPVKIVYIDQDGKKQIIEQVVEYTVSDCKN